MAARKHSGVRNLIVISDTHCGCKLGLCPPWPIRLDLGGTYQASKFQLGLWKWWREFWDEWVPEVTHGEPYDLVHNGDVIDGVHHRSTHQITQDLEDQIRIAEEVLRPEIEKCLERGGKYFHVRGTEAHVGQSGVDEERLARNLHATPNEEGQFARFDLWKRVGSSCLVHLLHHIGTTSSAAHESSAVNAELAAEYVESARWGREAPDFVVRSHRHRCIAVDLSSYKGDAAGIVTPAWQGKTPWTFKVPGARISEPQIGGILIRRNERKHYYERWVKTFNRTTEA